MPGLVETFLTAEKMYGWAQKVNKWWTPLAKEYQENLDEIGDTFGNPKSLAERYILPDCQQLNPADADAPLAIDGRRPVFDVLGEFIKKPPSHHGSENQSVRFGERRDGEDVPAGDAAADVPAEAVPRGPAGGAA